MCASCPATTGGRLAHLALGGRARFSMRRCSGQAGLGADCRHSLARRFRAASSPDARPTASTSSCSISTSPPICSASLRSPQHTFVVALVADMSQMPLILSGVPSQYRPCMALAPPSQATWRNFFGSSNDSMVSLPVQARNNQPADSSTIARGADSVQQTALHYARSQTSPDYRGAKKPHQ